MYDDKDRNIIIEDSGDLGFFENETQSVYTGGVFAKDLLPDESVIITAEGKTGRANIINTAFSVIWELFALFWTITACSMGGVFGIAGLPFLIIGAINFFVWGVIPTKVTIAVTDQRMLVRFLGRTKILHRGAALSAMILSTNDPNTYNIAFDGLFKEMNKSRELQEFELRREDALRISDIINGKN